MNPLQFKQKKKRAVDPNAPPRPNLMSHEKRMKESAIEFDQLARQVENQANELSALRTKFSNMQTSIDMLINYVRKNK